MFRVEISNTIRGGSERQNTAENISQSVDFDFQFRRIKKHLIPYGYTKI